MKIYFKTGQVMEDISEDVCTLIRDRILEEKGAKTFQCFSDEKNRLLFIINISEVLYIR